MHRTLRCGAAMAVAACLSPPPLWAGDALERAKSRYHSRLSELEAENAAMKSELSELKRLVEGLVASGPVPTPRTPAASPPPGSLTAGPSPDPVATSEEERALMAEFEKELGAAGKGTLAQPAPSSPAGRGSQPSYQPSLPWFSPQSGVTTGRRNFWGVGGIPGQTNVIDIGFTTEFIAGWSNSGGNNELENRFQLRESELALGGYVDPYHRADVLLVWNGVEDEVALEEGYMTFFRLPEGFRARVGRFRSRTGKVNALHLADLPWVTEPLVVDRFLGEEGFGQNGARLTYIGKPRGKWSWSLDMEAFQGDHETLVDPAGLIVDPATGLPDYAGQKQDKAKEDTITAFHLQNHFQIDEVTDLEVGYSRLHADNDRVRLDGIDLTFRKLIQPNYNEWKLQLEAMKQRREDLLGSGNDDRLGWYAWLDRRMSRNWAAGLRFDGVENLAPGDARDSSWSMYLTHFPTEFSWYRLQYQEDDLGAAGITDRQVYLQFRWQIGVDRHAIQ